MVENDLRSSKFDTNAYKYLASVADFERMSLIFICKHIRKHICLSVRAEEASTCETGMRVTVMCRATVAYRVRVEGIDISN